MADRSTGRQASWHLCQHSYTGWWPGDNCTNLSDTANTPRHDLRADRVQHTSVLQHGACYNTSDVCVWSRGQIIMLQVVASVVSKCVEVDTAVLIVSAAAAAAPPHCAAQVTATCILCTAAAAAACCTAIAVT
jgi:hypothetical protein